MGGYTISVCNKPTRSTQPCIPLGSLNRVSALIGWGNGGNVTSARWQVILCDPIWHVSSRSGAVLVAQTAIRFLTVDSLTVCGRMLMCFRGLRLLLVSGQGPSAEAQRLILLLDMGNFQKAELEVTSSLFAADTLLLWQIVG